MRCRACISTVTLVLEHGDSCNQCGEHDGLPVSMGRGALAVLEAATLYRREVHVGPVMECYEVLEAWWVVCSGRT